METTVSISIHLGNDLRTRSFFRRDMEKILENSNSKLILDFSGVVFISRSVADELYNLLVDYPALTITGMEKDVKMMYDVVVRGRKEPREYPHMNAKVYHLETMKELQEFFDAI